MVAEKTQKSKEAKHQKAQALSFQVFQLSEAEDKTIDGNPLVARTRPTVAQPKNAIVPYQAENARVAAATDDWFHANTHDLI